MLRQYFNFNERLEMFLTCSCNILCYVGYYYMITQCLHICYVMRRRLPISFKDGISLHSQPKVRFREYFVYFLMRQNSKKNQLFRRCREHWFYILLIPKNYQQISKKKLFNNKTGNDTFFSQNWFVNFSDTYEIHTSYFRFFSSFWKPCLSKKNWVVFAIRFHRLSRNFLSTVCRLFVKTCANFVTFDCFFDE